jgi:hypothetical protein
MKGYIDENGFLWIKRGNRMKKQYCKYPIPPGSLRPMDCGDWCPSFQGPLFHPVKENIHIQICENSILDFDEEFLDKRTTE